jgi:hypothetical protein
MKVSVWKLLKYLAKNILLALALIVFLVFELVVCICIAPQFLAHGWLHSSVKEIASVEIGAVVVWFLLAVVELSVLGVTSFGEVFPGLDQSDDS